MVGDEVRCPTERGAEIPGRGGGVRLGRVEWLSVRLTQTGAGAAREKAEVPGWGSVAQMRRAGFLVVKVSVRGVEPDSRRNRGPSTMGTSVHMVYRRHKTGGVYQNYVKILN